MNFKITFHTLSEFRDGGLVCVMGPYHTANKLAKMMNENLLGVARVHIEGNHHLKFAYMEQKKGIERFIGDPLLIIFERFAIFIIDKVTHTNVILPIHNKFSSKDIRIPDSLEKSYKVYTKDKSSIKLYSELKHFDTRCKEFREAYLKKFYEDLKIYQKLK